MFGQLLKMAKGGGLGPEQLASLCESLGMKVKLEEVARDEFGDTLRMASRSLTRPDTKLMRIIGRMPSGETMEALIILAPAAAGADRLPKAPLTPAIVAL